MGDLKNHWRRFVSDDQRAILGFFAVGDSLVRTNPLYGRGCSFAAVQSEILGQVVRETTMRPCARACTTPASPKRSGPSTTTCAAWTATRSARAQATREGDGPASLAERVGRSFRDDGVAIAVRSDLPLLRAALREFNMLDPPRAWVRQPATLAKSLRRMGARARGERALLSAAAGTRASGDACGPGAALPKVRGGKAERGTCHRLRQRWRSAGRARV